MYEVVLFQKANTSVVLSIIQLCNKTTMKQSSDNMLYNQSGYSCFQIGWRFPVVNAVTSYRNLWWRSPTSGALVQRSKGLLATIPERSWERLFPQLTVAAIVHCKTVRAAVWWCFDRDLWKKSLSFYMQYSVIILKCIVKYSKERHVYFL